MTKDNSTGKDKEFYSKGKQMFDNIEVIPTERKASMTDLTEASLEAALIEILKHMDDTGETIKLTPTHFIFNLGDTEMTKDQIMKLAREAGFEGMTDHPAVLLFAHLIAAAERKACAKLCSEAAHNIEGAKP